MRHTHARGRARRDVLLDAVRGLLHERPFDQITLPVVAERAKIPASSVYHFYADIADLHIELVRTIADEMGDITVPVLAGDTWSDIVTTFLRTSKDHFNADAAALQLMLGANTPPQIKHAACYDGYRFGRELHDLVAVHFILPEMTDPTGTFFRAIQIADALFSLSVMENGRVSDPMTAEATIATVSYLANYLPPILKRKPAEASILAAVRME